jgi:broad specificity phosphatase PhoE
MRIFVFARHSESVLNLEQRINGDPTVDVPLTEAGRAEAAQLGQQLSMFALDACIHTRFPRTAETAAIALAGRDVPMIAEPLFDDIDVGDLDGGSIDDYRAWKRAHTRSDAFPGGESLDDVARRYLEGFRRLLANEHARVLLVVHEIPVRYALNGAAGSDSLDGPAHQIPNATPYLFDDDALARAITGIERIVARVPA